MTALIFDTETTDTDDEAEIIEAAWVKLPDTPAGPYFSPPANTHHQRFKPTRRISYGAMAVHHIVESDLADCPPCSQFRLPIDTAFLIGHSIDFDWQKARSPEDVKRICTLAMARDVWPEMDSHTQTAIMYMLFGEGARELVKGAHSAFVDVVNNLQVLKAILAIYRERGEKLLTWDDVWEVSERARLPKKMPFGKHKGVPLREVPRDYLAWCLRQSDIDPYLIKAIKAL